MPPFVAARGRKQLPLVQFDGGLLDLPAVKNVQTRQDKSKPPQENSHTVKFCKDLDAHMVRVRDRIKAERLQKEREVVTSKELKKLEQGFTLNFSKKVEKNYTSPKERLGNVLSQMPLVAAKIYKELQGEYLEAAERTPISVLLARNPEAPKAGDHSNEFYELGEEVEVRDKDMTEWRTGVVTDVEPLKVTLLGWDQAFQWDSVRRSNAKSHACSVSPTLAKQCICGFRFHEEALFCCGCGAKRGIEGRDPNGVACPRPPLQPRRPPRPPSAEGSVKQRRASASPHLRRGSPARVPISRSSSDSASSRGLLTCCQCGGSHALKDCPQRFAFNGEFGGKRTMAPNSGSKSQGAGGSCKWNTGTVQILGDNGEVIAIRPHALNSMRWGQETVPLMTESGGFVPTRPGFPNVRQWEQHTVPILSDDGEVFAVRQNSTIGNQWEHHTVPLLGENGEIFALRENSTNRGDWEQRTVPLMGEDGEVFGLRPSGSCYDSIAKKVELHDAIESTQKRICNNVRPSSVGHYLSAAYAPRPPRAESSSFSRATSSLGVSVVSPIPSDLGTDRDWHVRSILAAHESLLRSQGKQCESKLQQSIGMVSDISAPDLGTSMLPIPSDLGTSISRTEPPNEEWEEGDMDAKSILAAREFQSKGQGQQVQAKLQQSIGMASDVSVPDLGTSMLPIPSDVGTPSSHSLMDCLRPVLQENDLSMSDTYSQGFGTSMLPIPSDIGEPSEVRSALRTLDSQQTNSLVLNDSSGNGADSVPLEHSPSSAPDILVIDTAEEQGAQMELSSTPLSPKNSCSEASSLASNVDLSHLIRCASSDSMRSINEVLEMANAARMATPDGHMMDILREALMSRCSSTNISRCPSGSTLADQPDAQPRRPPLLPEAPEVVELAARLRQLPELWRNTIFQMLRQAEEIQKGVEEYA